MLTHIQSFVWRVEAEARFTGRARAITCIGNIWKYAVISAHKGKSNTLFGIVKGLLLFVCTHNINKTCFYKIKKKKQDALSGEYLPHWLDKYIYRKHWITTLKRNNSNQKQKLFHYKIPKEAFLFKGASNEEMESGSNAWMIQNAAFPRSIGNF